MKMQTLWTTIVSHLHFMDVSRTYGENICSIPVLSCSSRFSVVGSKGPAWENKTVSLESFFSENTNQTIPNRRLYTTTNRTNNDNDSETSNHVWMYAAYWCTYVYIYIYTHTSNPNDHCFDCKKTFFWKKNKGQKWVSTYAKIANSTGSLMTPVAKR